MITRNNEKIPGFLFGISSRGCCVVVVVVEVVVVGGGGGVQHAEKKMYNECPVQISSG